MGMQGYIIPYIIFRPIVRQSVKDKAITSSIPWWGGGEGWGSLTLGGHQLDQLVTVLANDNGPEIEEL